MTPPTPPGKPGNTGFRHLVHATRYSLRGLGAALRHESAFRQEAALLLLLVPAALWIGRSPGERALLVAVYLVVLVAELINSAIEAAVDHTSTAHHELAGRAKDLGSAAVFVAVVLASVAWLGVCWEVFAPGA